MCFDQELDLKVLDTEHVKNVLSSEKWKSLSKDVVHYQLEELARGEKQDLSLSLEHNFHSVPTFLKESDIEIRY